MRRGLGVRSAWAVLPLVIVVGGLAASDATEKDATELRVMSFNVRYGLARDGKDSWPHRRDLLVETVRSFDPDLLGTQETQGFQAEFLEDRLPDYAAVGWSRDAPDGEQCTIFYRSSRFEREDAGQFWLSDTPEVPGSRSWDSALPRIVTWTRLRDRRQERVLVFFNTHFDHRGRRARCASARLLRERIAQVAPSGAFVVTGDFNCAEGSAPYETLVGSPRDGGRVIDSYRAAHPRPRRDEGTFHGFRGRRGGGRIDWILHSPELETVSAAIDHTQRDGRYPSDHFPVTAILRWAVAEAAGECRPAP